MTWKKPEAIIVDHTKAVAWWLREHFTQSNGTANATWAMDLYASYLDACVETASMPIISAAAFGRVVGDLCPRTSYRNTTTGGERKSGYQYMVTPLDGVSLYLNGKCKSGPKELAKLYAQAMTAAGAQNSWEWSAFEDLARRDKRVLTEWLAARGMKAATSGEATSTKLLHDEFAKSYGWSYQRFNKTLSRLGKVKRGDNGARKVVYIQQLEKVPDGERQAG